MEELKEKKMMKRFILVVLLLVLSLLSFGCEKEEEIQIKSVEDANVNLDVLKDRDILIKLVKNSDDFNTISYSDQELIDMKDNYDYKKVLNDFVKDKLKEELETFQTVSNTVNPRWMVVTTKNHKVYYISMQKWNNYNGIWTVINYTEFSWSTYPTNEAYKLLKKEDINGKLLDWFNSEMKTAEWKTDYTQIDGKTYALVKSSSKDSDSVELDDVITFQGTAELRYQAFDYQSVTQETKALINDYLLIQINLPDSEIPIDFIKTFTNIK
jgi:hypothetical protein